MSIFYSNRSFFEKGITYSIPYNTLTHVNFSIKLLKAFENNVHEAVVHELIDKLAIKMYRTSDTTINLAVKAPFNRAQILGIAYRKHFTRCLRTIIRYNYTNTDFLTAYINHYVTEDLKRYGG